MKKVIILVALLFSIDMLAQVPQGINYQSVVRGSNGNPLANQPATFNFNYIDKSDNSIDYIETFQTVTDEFGVVNFVLGTGTIQTGSFSGLDWTKQFRIDIFVNLGSGFAILGSQDLVSVPYALNADHADMSLGELTDVETGGAISGNVLMFDGTSWIPSDISSGGGFGLPFLGNDPNLVSFGVTNSSALGGSAIYGQTNINSSNATGVKGQSTGANGRGVYGTATGNNAFGVLGENTQGTAIRGTTSGAGANGVHGLANSATGVGVRGESNDGTGVIAYSTNGTGVNTSSINGDALYTNSLSGYAINSSGNVKISGGNTNPGAGKVLTSDASGNATWQTLSTTPKVAFLGHGPEAVVYPPGVETQFRVDLEVYDFSNSFDASTDRFTAPVGGLYHFSASTWISLSSLTSNIEYPAIILYVNHNGVETPVATTVSTTEIGAVSSKTSLNIDCDVLLSVNDQVYVKIWFSDNADGNATTGQYYETGHFYCGHLVFQN